MAASAARTFRKRIETARLQNEMHIEALKKFCDLVETESISLTADRNFVSQSAISQQIRMLEDKFARRLINRGRGQKEIYLTSAGRIFYRGCKNVLASYAALGEEMRGRRDSIYPAIRVASVYSVGFYDLPEKMREFLTKFPAAKINLEYSRATRVLRDVLRQEVELGIVAFPEPRRELEIVPMASDRLVLICPPNHEYAKREQLTIKELARRDFVQFERDLPTSKAIDKIFKSYGVAIIRKAEFDNIETIKCAVESGLGLAIVPRSSVVKEARNEQLAVVEMAEMEWSRPVGAIYRRNRTLSVTAKKFVQLLRCACDNRGHPAKTRIFAESIVSISDNFTAIKNG